MEGTVFNVQRFSVHDGPGIRTTVFLKGCPLRCLWCHNPESQKSAPEKMLYPSKCTGCGRCKEVCPHAFESDCPAEGKCIEVCRSGAREIAGKRRKAEEVADICLRDREYYKTSSGGVTISGGEPLMQAGFTGELLSILKKEGIHTAVETCGFAKKEVILSIAEKCDLIIYDIKGIDEEKHVKNTGVSNRLILENAEALMKEGKSLLFRMPYVPGYNSDEAGAVREFTKGFPLELMAYHDTGKGKYRALSREYEVTAPVPSKEEMMLAAEKYRAIYSPSGVN